MSFQDGDVFNVDVVMYKDGTDGVLATDMHAVDVACKLRTGTMKIILLNKFISHVVAFLHQFRFAEERLREAGALAAGTATEAAANFQEKSMRVELDIDVKVATTSQHVMT